MVYGWTLRWSWTRLKMAHDDLLFQVTRVQMLGFIHFKSNNLRSNWCRITKFCIWMNPKMVLEMSHVDLLLQVTKVELNGFKHLISNNLRTNWCNLTKFGMWIHLKMILDKFENGPCWPTFPSHKRPNAWFYTLLKQ